MNGSIYTTIDLTIPLFVSAGDDRFGEFKVLGISSVAVKVSSQENKDLFSVEITLHEKGGPARHVHYEQDEWFYILEGEFIIEAGDQSFLLNPGDSLFVAKKVPHVWAFVGETRGRMLASVTPAGKLEEFFINAAKYSTLPGSDQNLWKPYGLEWLGPPLQLA